MLLFQFRFYALATSYTPDPADIRDVRNLVKPIVLGLDRRTDSTKGGGGGKPGGGGSNGAVITG